MLDHEYSQRGLAVRRLKGADAERVAHLLDAAEQADCEVVFALAEIQETRDAFLYEDSRAWGWFDPWDEDDDDWDDQDDDVVDLEYVGDLMVDGTTLVWWARPDGTDGENISLNLGGDEVWAVTSSSELEPFVGALRDSGVHGAASSGLDVSPAHRNEGANRLVHHVWNKVSTHLVSSARGSHPSERRLRLGGWVSSWPV